MIIKQISVFMLLIKSICIYFNGLININVRFIYCYYFNELINITIYFNYSYQF